jgi:hypothetical protein
MFFEASKDASKVYFISPEQLDGDRGTQGAPNLYLHAGGANHFVATLDQSDANFSVSVDRDLIDHDTKLLFESRARITAYDNAGFSEVYEYDQSDGRVLCVSCRPDGIPADGPSTLRTFPSGTVSKANIFTKNSVSVANADESGRRIFFQSSDSILPRDTNGNWDVYEFEPQTGQMSLISTGKSDGDSSYLGNGRDGRDVFILSLDQLAPQDHSAGTFKVYDARVGGGIPFDTQQSTCQGEACRGQASSASGSQMPTTSSYVGAGNPKPQAKRPLHKKHRKHKRHHKKHGGKDRHKGKRKTTHKHNTKVQQRAHSNGRTGR